MKNIVGTSLSKQVLWLHAHEQTKLHAEMSWIASVYECRLCIILTWSNLNWQCIICTVCEQPAIDSWSVAAVTRCRRRLNLSRLCYSCQRCTLAVAQHCPSPSYLLSARGHSIFEKYFNAHLKFMVYGRKQTSMLQTHFRNAVQLVWGSLRLVPINKLIH